MKKNILLSFAVAAATLVGFASCSDDDTEARLPEFGSLTVSSATLTPGEDFKITVNFKDPGSYVKGTYTYSTSPVSTTTGEFKCGSSEGSTKVVSAKAPLEAGTYTLTVRPKSMSANAGNKPYIEVASMGTVSTKITTLSPDPSPVK